MSTSVSPGTFTDTEAPSVVEKDKNEDVLVAVMEKVGIKHLYSH